MPTGIARIHKFWLMEKKSKKKAKSNDFAFFAASATVTEQSISH
jgi:hypothetical protein